MEKKTNQAKPGNASLFSERSKGGEAAVGTGTLPVGVQGRSALPVGDMGCRSLNRSNAGRVRR